MWLECEEMKWKQRSRVAWLKEGDMNSRFFHIKVTNRRCKNHITSLFNAEGVSLEGKLLDSHIVNYFQSLFFANTMKGPIDSP